MPAGSSKSDKRLTQEAFDMFAALAVLLKDRLRALEEELGELERCSRNHSPVVDNVEAAYRYHDLKRRVDDAKQEMIDLAGDMVGAGAPLNVWIRYAREDNTNLIIRVTPNKGVFSLSVLEEK